MSHSPDALAENCHIKCDSNLGEGTLLTTRWIIPLHRHTPGQRCAHLITCFRITAAANIAIREGLVIMGKRSWARCMWREPRRCLRCQSLMARHLTAGCNHQITCGTCGKEHHTTECTEMVSSRFWCVNCKLVGHASWDRLCPMFLEACKWLETSDPEHMYKYFPSQDTWTWEQETT